MRKAVHIPLIAAGGIASGAGMLAAMSLGADGVQIGTRFALSEESSAHVDFKQLCTTLNEGDTVLSLKKLSPTRMVKNDFFNLIKEAEGRGASVEELQNLLGRGRSRLGIFEGDLKNGELEIGQIASFIQTVEPVERIMKSLITEYNQCLDKLMQL